jgi:hypothetical protein
MRDAQSALDQVIAFAGSTIGVEDVSTVLGSWGATCCSISSTPWLPRTGRLRSRSPIEPSKAGHDLRLVLRSCPV